MFWGCPHGVAEQLCAGAVRGQRAAPVDLARPARPAAVNVGLASADGQKAVEARVVLDGGRRGYDRSGALQVHLGVQLLGADRAAVDAGEYEGQADAGGEDDQLHDDEHLACSSRVDQCDAIANRYSTRLEGDAFDAPAWVCSMIGPTRVVS